MIITHVVSPFFFRLFPQLKGSDNESIVTFFKDFYAWHGVVPDVVMEEGIITVKLDGKGIQQLKKDFNAAIQLCEKGHYQEAKPLLEYLLKKDPNHSEYYRFLGKIESELGNVEGAMDYLLEALRKDSSNAYALLMMGDVFAKQKKDIETALIYYNQALETNPEDFITLTNIGYSLLKERQHTDAKRFLNQAVEANPEYANAWLALAFLESECNADFEAFSYALQAIKFSMPNDLVHNNARRVAEESALNCLTDVSLADQMVLGYIEQLEAAGGLPIKRVLDETITTVVEIEFAENYDRDHHLIKYKNNHPAYQHLVMHELVHLDLVIEARHAQMNQLFVADATNLRAFGEAFKAEFYHMKGLGYGEAQINNIKNSLFEGINHQLYNTPIDLFIEHKLFHEYPKLRPFQFLSLLHTMQVGIDIASDAAIQKAAPKKISFANKVLNMVLAMQFNSLYGYPLVAALQPTKRELKQAETFYQEFLEYVADRQPGEEYELLMHWTEDLQLDPFSKLISEIEYQKTKSEVDNFLTVAIDDALFDDEDAFKARLSKEFLDNAEAKGVDMAVVMYMVQAHQVFAPMTVDEIKKIAFEIAMLGGEDIRTDISGFKVAAMPNLTFSGLKLLAFYYVSWAIAIPEMLVLFEMPYDKEFEVAKNLV
ncbi:MAG: tetratricopeptide repeat protein [Schleiferiaceae bacterium]|nr:tetratricopeptide repeat protein [Schleiferiaceae bacterium]